VTPDEARDAYLSGWAISGGPLTERVRAGCDAAVRTALEHADDPRILEVTLRLGHLTGVWATVYDRRHKLLAKHTQAVTSAWRDCVRGLDASLLIDHYRSTVPADDPSGNPAWRRREAAAVVVAWLIGIYRSDGFDALLDALLYAIRDGMAEGEADALILAADRAGKVGFDIDAAFTAAYERLDGNLTLTGRAQDVLTRILDGASGDVARLLIAADQTDKDLADAIAALLDADNVRAVTVWVDWGVWAALGAGILGLFGLAGVTEISWVTAGDSRVCAICAGNEDNGPYPPWGVPEFPGHPGGCRCSLDTTSSIPASFIAAHLGVAA
jgi:hypothetical protein